MATFVMGDVHGAYKAMIQALTRANFDPEVDTLISLGDIADNNYLCLMKRDNYFYVLKANSSSEIRYFGRTIDPKARLKRHIKESYNGCNTYKCSL